MTTFKPGDRVRCVDSGGTFDPPLIVGGVYTAAATDHHQNVHLVGYNGGYYPRRFELVAPVSPVDPDEWDDQHSLIAREPLIFLALLGHLRHFGLRWRASEPGTVTVTLSRKDAELWGRQPGHAKDMLGRVAQACHEALEAQP